MSFAAPVWILIGLAVVILLAMAFRAADRRRRRDLERFAAHQLIDDLTVSASPTRRRLKRNLLLAATALCFLALAGPEIGFTWEETHRRGIDVMIAVDVSRSMLAQDVAPDRLDRAKLAVADLLERLGGDRVGLIAFAGRAFLQCPLTLDDAAFRRALDALEPGVIPAPGSDLASALDEAVRAFSTEARNVKILVLFSDGEDLSGGALAAAKGAAEANIRVFTVGVGTPAGELIPVKDDDGSTEFVKDKQGQIVKSRLDEATLRKVAETTGGFYVPLGSRNEGVATIVEQALAPIPKEELASKLRRVPQNRYQWPLGLALLLILIEPFVGERRRVAKASSPVRQKAAAATLVAAMMIPARAPAAEKSPDEAQALYEQQKYPESFDAWRAASEGQDDPRLDFNLGAAAYRSEKYPEAAEAFARTLRAEDQALRENGFYNLGNAQFRVGQQSRETNPQQTAQAWQQAIDSYDAALRLDEKDEDARANRDLVAKLLQELQQQQQQQPQDDDQKKDEEDKKEQEESKQEEQPPRDENQEGESGEEKPREQPQSSPQPGEGEQKDEGKDQKQEDQQSPGAPTPTPAKADPKDSQPSPGGDSGSQGKQNDQRQAQPNPAEMSPEEARELLESLSADDEMRPMPLAPEQSAARAGAAQDERDW